MANITSSSGISGLLGQFSGIGAEQIEDLLKGDAIPKTRAENRVEEIKAQKTAWSDVKTRLNNFLSKIESLQKPEAFQTKIVTSSNDKIATIKGTADALEGKYQLTVERLATATNQVGKKMDSTTESLGSSGELTLKTADLDADGNPKSFTINIDSGDNLKDVVNKINKTSKESGINAVIMDNRLVLTDSKTGNRDFEIGGDMAEAVGLGAESTKTVGVDAEFTLNGIEMKRQSNNIDDVIDGITLELKETSKETVHLSLKNDTDKLKSSVKEFVSQYNSLMTFINESASVGDPSAKDNKTGALSGDSSLVRLQTELRNLIAPPHTLGSDVKATELGLSISDRQGTLSFDEKKFDEMLKKDPNALKDFFYKGEKVAGETKPKESGYTMQLKEITDKYLVDKTGEKGVIASKFDSYELAIKDLNKQITRFDEVLEQKKARYVDMFSRLDQAMMEAESQMSWLASQVASFNGGQ
ncbi:flagellar filament capping protein FliD [Enterococcus alcedinis]|uniref:Flagellar hook-associated protein 2 n=1 Tax=Enterococcus alcedinis TaxID=1274384 RepID=A0A917N5D2_9ENTE|nr:flagellar filament capping protein FliD [Enterococcus alcedinis]MBP2102627.1 flagellar hook-associated protein 2 [Enterococcus alcedinis]GGI66186.1 hypothetical protein GCM10011482_18400 [Enterococcus alcedinis]